MVMARFGEKWNLGCAIHRESHNLWALKQSLQEYQVWQNFFIRQLT